MSIRAAVSTTVAAGVAAGLGLAACGGAGAGRPEPRSIPAGSGAQCARVHRDSGAPVRTDGARVGSTVVLAQQGTRTLAYIADTDERAIAVVDVDSGKTLRSEPLDGTPGQLLLTADGRLLATVRDRSRIEVLELPSDPSQAPEGRCSVSTATEPIGLAMTPDDRTVLVTSGWGHRLAAFDATELRRSFEVELSREPRSVLVSDDGSAAFVSHVVGGRLSRVDLASAKHEVRTVELAASHEEELAQFRKQLQAARAQSKGADASTTDAALEKMVEAQEAAFRQALGERAGCQGYALASSTALRGRLFAPEVLVDAGVRERRTAGYGEDRVSTEIPTVAVVDEATARPVAASLRAPTPWGARVEENQAECLLPRAAAVDPDSRTLLVTCLGIDAVVGYDAASADPGHAERLRWRVGAGPTGIAMDRAKRRAVVWSQFDRSLGVIALNRLDPTEQDADRAPSARTIALAPGAHPIAAATALGRLLFHSTGDPRIARDGRACASCHPEGRDDGLTWATPNGPRRTLFLAGRLSGTAPYGWDGQARDLREHLANTFDRLSGAGGLRSLELDALIAYVSSLQPPPAPAAQRDGDAERGARVFASSTAGCSSCHAGAALTDNRAHDVESKTVADRAPAFNTPSLRYLAGKGPYFHDGRYPTLRTLLEAKMGHASQLSPTDRAALEAFLESL